MKFYLYAITVLDRLFQTVNKEGKLEIYKKILNVNDFRFNEMF